MLQYELDLQTGSTWDNYPSDPAFAGLPCLLTESGCFHVGPRHFTTRDSKNALLILYTLRGKGKLTYSGKTYSLPPASLVFLDCRNWHDYRADSAEGWSYRFLHFDGEGVQFYKRQLENEFTVLCPQDTAQIDRYFAEIDRLAGDDSLMAVARRSNMVVSILWRLLEQHTAEVVSSVSLRTDMQDVREYIQSHLADDLSLEQLMSVVHLSKYHFVRLFKEQFGVTPGKYILRSRMSAAKRLLVTTALPVYEIATAVGFSDTASFYRAFREVEGASPGSVRRESLLWEEADGLHQTEPTDE
ncbi:MAG: helix-turn-helix transcriptional regulator [Clostridia bacterium]|nr:helix-turn-helix transcriptional regulator [Clostridia bacterium]